MADQLLALAILWLIGLITWMAVTNRTTPKERDEMLRDEEMWP